ncbi:hypothetical protein EVAR_59711_1 [Eumeta japonica]|uniref:Uncharacterized protein n=1 Tax=Eumeta variegata TaxID=151549 RepID=A0A4C1XJI2_EUMVA|nr:hypothetical protein EVAR_59711_1 [Eumeta japonica]
MRLDVSGLHVTALHVMLLFRLTAFDLRPSSRTLVNGRWWLLSFVSVDHSEPICCNFLPPSVNRILDSRHFTRRPRPVPLRAFLKAWVLGRVHTASEIGDAFNTFIGQVYYQSHTVYRQTVVDTERVRHQADKVFDIAENAESYSLEGRGLRRYCDVPPPPVRERGCHSALAPSPSLTIFHSANASSLGRGRRRSHESSCKKCEPISPRAARP